MSSIHVERINTKVIKLNREIRKLSLTDIMERKTRKQVEVFGN